jgi:KaiC/GvpD/RAD55 family RecA-like ATPase
LDAGENALFVALDDNPQKIKMTLTPLLKNPVRYYEQHNQLRFVDAYSWSYGISEERFSLTGTLELNQLSALISDAGFEIGQTIQKKEGGIRIIDSISSLLTGFELSQVQRFINQIARTSVAFGGMVTLFFVEEGTVSTQILNNIKYAMDGIVEFIREDDIRKLRVVLMKWTQFNPTWISLKKDIFSK